MRLAGPLVLSCLFPAALPGQQAAPALPPKPSVVFKVQYASQRLEMTVRSSRILSLERKILQFQVSNPDVLELTPLTPSQLQVSAKANGVTEVNIWDEEKRLFTVNVIVHGDTRELELVLQSQFPHATLRATPAANSVIVSGYVDQPEEVERVIRIAEEFYPKVINNLKVGGCQQVLLHVKLMEVSRTKLRRLGFDFSKVTGPSVLTSGPAGLLSNAINTTPSANPLTPWAPVVASGAGGALSFGVVNGSNAFFGVLDALRQDDLMKILSEPTLVAINGEKASFNSGGQIPVPTPQSLGTLSIDWKNYGTQVKFIPIVLGNGRIRLDVNPVVSELDYSTSTTIQGTTVPGIRFRDVHTIVEMEAGQTLAIGGLVQTVVEAENGGLPWISEVPYLGAAFRHVSETRNEIELLIMVTPEWVEAMDASQVPPCGPGTQTTSPSDWELFMKGHLEVPNCCPTGGGNGPCGPGGDAAGGPPPDGMMPAPGEQVPAPPPADGPGQDAGATRDGSRPAAAATARRRPEAGNASAGAGDPYNRYNPAGSAEAASPAGSRSGPPGLIGPIGYDVVK
jgi:pilus assembly protein CpaC